MLTILLLAMLMMEWQTEELVKLPPPQQRGQVSLEQALAARRSLRTFGAAPLAWQETGQLLWAAQGVTEPREGLRTAPSAGALYPLEIYVATAAGVFHYQPRAHQVQRVLARDCRTELSRAAWEQECVRDAPAVFILTAFAERTARKYGERSRRYVAFEAGHAAQNLLLQATALGLGAVPVGAFSDARLASVLPLAAGEQPLYLIPVGRPE
ncbi:MAG: SagB/ThcOx family dehydrogenase [candidate division KSB1 bacterium]|nr:SagB/ThcOx family dehydrogenase [candidate division KSB1 bacterium]MDZ7276300.1 SagB/ThcOx family dehydrogenase [candidate division KSB1 bacterium]MDZ7287747.1 SagB/ThcOx family dehydrogenase [candidate division KSB1 bacterium]MDZ7299913.1 SagB/ThcOx family dehydrogenase [candidate division KSB1 bacterium]MDZ7308373.1 SagB/ThcOx family dehydrogenase [candidate division KSB1 bacterium]